MKKLVFTVSVLSVFFLVSAGISAQTGITGIESRPTSTRPNTFSVGIHPGVDIPLGESGEYFSLGGSALVLAEYAFTEQPVFFVSGDFNYSYSPLQTDQSLSMLSGGAGGGLYLNLSPRFISRVFVRGGYYYGFFNDPGSVVTGGETSGGGPYVAGGLGLYYLLTPLINLGVGVSYINYFGLYGGLNASIGTSFYLSGANHRRRMIESSQPLRPDLLMAKKPQPGEGLEFADLSFNQVFPVFYKYYDDHPIGTLVLYNQDEAEVQDIKVTLLIKRYMDASKESQAIGLMEKGQQEQIDLFALFNENVLSITEGTKVAAEITLEYEMRGEQYRDTRVETIRMYDRNAMTWDDDRKAAAFITAKDPAVLNFAKNAVGMIRDGGNTSVNENLLKAIALHEALRLHGVSYVIDPRTPYIELSKNESMVDFLQFPRQTFSYKAGDCDDLSILYCALLEAIGIETALITIPGHIFMAFSTGISAEEAKKAFHSQEELVFKEDKVWIPLEVTLRDEGFVKSWETGAKQWREHVLKDQSGFYSVHDAWTQYEPVGLPGEGLVVTMPPEAKILEAYNDEVTRFIGREIFPQIEAIETTISRRGENHRLRNKMGVLYARYGLMNKAEGEFVKVLTANDYLPTLINLGNMYYLRGQWYQALEYYQRASKKAPENPTVLLGIARVYHELENYKIVEKTYEQLKDKAPDVANRFTYLEMTKSEGVRSADVVRLKGIVLWEEE